MVTVYVLQGRVSGKRYVGMTNDLPRRLAEHRGCKSKGGQIIGEFDVVYTEHHPDYAPARLREKFLKSGQGREWLKEQAQRSRLAAGG